MSYDSLVMAIRPCLHHADGRLYYSTEWKEFFDAVINRKKVPWWKRMFGVNQPVFEAAVFAGDRAVLYYISNDLEDECKRQGMKIKRSMEWWIELENGSRVRFVLDSDGTRARGMSLNAAMII